MIHVVGLIVCTAAMLRTLPSVAPCSTITAFTKQKRFSTRRLVRMAAAKKVLVPIGTGSEEMEAVITIDVLRRAGAEVTVASVESGLEVECSRKVKLLADKLIQDCSTEDYDLIALPVCAACLLCTKMILAAISTSS